MAAASRCRDTSEMPSRAWLFQVARSRLIDHWRREARGSRKLRLVFSQSGKGEQADPADEVTSAETVMAALDQLPPDQRAALVLRYLDGYSVSRVADALERSVRAAESLLVRARRSLELELKEQLNG